MSLLLFGGLFVIVSLATSSILWVKRDAIPEGMAAYVLDRLQTSMNRVVIILAYSILALMQMNIASKVHSEAEAEAIINAIQIGPLSVDPWNFGLWILSAWMLVPILVLNLRLIYSYRKYGTETLMSNEFWSDSA